MLRPGDTIENPVTGETMVFRETAAETDGELLRFDLFVEPGGYPTTEHVHPRQSERFTVEAGELHLRKAGAERRYRAGDTVVVPAGTPHIWWNSGDSVLHTTVELRPAGDFDEFIETLFALARDGQTDEEGMPNLLQLSVMMKKYRDVIYPTRPPRPLQKALFSALAPIGKLLGYRPDHPYRGDMTAETGAGG